MTPAPARGQEPGTAPRGRNTGTVRRAARLLLYLCTAAVVLALGKVHARYIGGYDYTGSLRFVWSFAYIGLLCLAAYGVGLPDLARTGKVAIVSAVVAIGAAALGISALQLLIGSAELPRFVVFGAALALVPVYVALSVVSAGGRARAEGRDRVVLVGAADEAASLQDELAGHPERSATLSATLSPEAARSLEARVEAPGRGGRARRSQRRGARPRGAGGRRRSSPRRRRCTSTASASAR